MSEEKKVKFIDLSDYEQSAQLEKRFGMFADSVLSYLKRFPMEMPRSAAEFVIVRTLGSIADQFFTIKQLLHFKNVSESHQSTEASTSE